jgi:hypothetical protein
MGQQKPQSLLALQKAEVKPEEEGRKENKP